MENYNLFVLDNGFVFIGDGQAFECPLLGKSIRIKNAYNIRNWGTQQKGLGWLAIDGKQPETKIDFNGTIDVKIERVCFKNPLSEKAKNSFYGK